MSSLSQPDRQRFHVTTTGDVYGVRNAAKALALAIGFSATASEEIALAVSELTSNLVKHANGGTLALIPVSEQVRVGIQIESHDNGPGIQDIQQMLTDGVSTGGSLGYGLGAVNRLMDEFDISSTSVPPNNGTHIICKRFVRHQEAEASRGLLDFGAATRAHPLMDVNGDTFVIKQWGTSALVGVIDGLGHGPYAQRASQSARQYVESHYDQPLASIFLGAGRACYATRGAVMALARFDWPPTLSPVTFSFCSIGNIEVRVIGKSEPMNFVVKRGIVGVNAPVPTVTEHRWNANYIMVLHSDGISSHWSWTSYPDLAKAPAKVIAARLLQGLASDRDDATVIVVRNAEG